MSINLTSLHRPAQLLSVVFGVALVMLGSSRVEADVVGLGQFQVNQNAKYGDGPDELTLLHRITPQLTNTVPAGDLFIYYEDGQQVYNFNVLANTTIQNQPVQIESDLSCDLVDPNQCLYTILFVDQDYPSPDSPTCRLYVQWIEYNIPKANFAFGSNQPPKGQTLVPYQGPNPTKGFHRLSFVVYGQRGPISPQPITDRSNFNARVFAAQNSLDEARAVNTALVKPSDR